MPLLLLKEMPAFQETEKAIPKKNAAILAVEMEVAAVYVFAKARNCAVLALRTVGSSVILKGLLRTETRNRLI